MAGPNEEEEQQRALRQLHQAAADDDAERVRQILAEGNVTVDAVYNGLTAFELAWFYICVEVMRALLEAGADGRSAWDRSRHLRWIVLGMFAVDALALLLDFGVIDVNETFPDLRRFTFLLSMAAHRRNEDAVRLLLERGANIDAVNDEGMSALHWACGNNGLGPARLLLEAGANPNLRDRSGWTPLYTACEFPQSGLRMLELLLVEFGAEVDARCGHNRWTALVAVLKSARPEERKRELAAFLLSQGANVNIRMRHGRTPLHAACGANQLEVLGFLLPAAPIGVEMVRFLLENGADVEAVDDRGRTPFDLAVQEGRDDVVKALLDYQSDVLPEE